MSQTITPPAFPDAADLAMAAHPFPVRDALQPLTHASAVAHLRACRGWWLDLAAAYADLAAAANRNGDPRGAGEAMDDARAALAKSDTYAPR